MKFLFLFCTLAFLLSSGYAQQNQTTASNETAAIAGLNDFIKTRDNAYQNEFFRLEEAFSKDKDNQYLILLYQTHLRYLNSVDAYDSLIYTAHYILNNLQVQDRDIKTDIYLRLAVAHNFNGNYDSLLFWKNESQTIIAQRSPYYPRLILLNGLKSFYDGDYTSSIRDLMEAIPLFEAQGDLKNLSLAYSSIALDYDRLGDFSTQREFLLKAIAIHERTGDTYNLILNYNNIGSSFNRQDSLSKALEYYSLAFDQLKEQNQPMLSAQNMTNRANILEKQGRLLEAEALFLECEQICEENIILYGVVLSNLNLGNLYRQMKEYDKSQIRLERSIGLASELKVTREVMLGHERLAWLWRDMGDYERAYASLSEFYTLKDSILNESVRKEALDLKEKYEAEKKENQIITLSKNKIYQQYLIALMAGGLILLLALAQWWRNKQKLTRVNLEITEKLYQAKEETLKQREKDLLDETMEKIAIKEQMRDLIQKIDDDKIQGKIKSQLRSMESRQNPWSDMIEKFKLLNPEFVANLLQLHPQLNQNDLEFCSLIKMNLSTKEIATLLRITDQSVRTRRYRLLKKLGLSKETDLSSWIRSLKG